MKATQILIFVVCMSAAAGLMASSGLNDDLGVNPDTDQIDDAVEGTEDNFSVYSATQTSDTFLTDIFLVTAILNTVKDSYNTLLSLPSMLTTMGIPEWVTEFVLAPMALILGFLFIFVAIGRDVSR